ncbi:phage integrase [Flammeovirgaceae bacterium 311]|nr:phage integrase [Flammeovirgaceae bacterium 311]
MKNAEIRTRLSKDKSTLTVEAYVSLQRIPFQRSTGVVIPAKSWDSKTMRVLPAEPNYKELNTQISDYLDMINEHLAKLGTQGTKTELLALVDGKVQPAQVVEEKKVSLMDVMKILIADSVSGVRKGPREKQIAPQSITQYKVTKKKIFEFAEETGYDLTDWERIQKDFHVEFKNWMYSKGLVDATLHRNFKNLKAGVNYVQNEEVLELPVRINTKKLKVNKGVRDDVFFLLPDEQNILWNMTFNDVRLERSREALNRTRDLWMVQSNLVLRINALNSIREEHYHRAGADHFLKVWDKKAAKWVTHQLDKTVVEIIERWKGKLPEGYLIPNNIAEANYREHIKEMIGELGKFINQLVENGQAKRLGLTVRDLHIITTVQKPKNGDYVKITQPYYKFFSSHEARRSGICALILEGVDREIVKKKATHSENSVEISRYYKILDIYMNNAVHQRQENRFKKLNFTQQLELA